MADALDRSLFSPGQVAAFDAVMRWIQDRDSDQVFRLFGFAGTGKTSIARALVAETGKKAAYMAYTGKAALVMQRSGCADARTIHSSIYTPNQDEETGEVTYELKLASELIDAGIIVLDECSMVDEDLAKDLLSLGKRILALGDPAQLPPVKGAGFFTNAEPDALLTEIHRQAAENPILQAATAAREGRPIAFGEWGRLSVLPKSDAGPEHILAADQVLVGTNKTRADVNAWIRRKKGREAPMPARGDRLVCLKNNRETGLLNGGLFTVDQLLSTSRDWIQMRVQSQDFPERPPQVVGVRKEFFFGGLEDVDWRILKDSDQFAYGYALTVHKAQGSQWENVLLYDESRAFREDARRWLYTGITRASENLTIIQGAAA